MFKKAPKGLAAKTEKQFLSEMKRMIRRVQAGEDIDDAAESIETMEVLAECIRRGYINGETEFELSDGRVKELRTEDGKAHPQIVNNIIPLDGLAFLRPDRTKMRANLALILSALAVLLSLFALGVSFLSNLDKIMGNWAVLVSLFR